MSYNNNDLGYFNGLGATSKTIPIQTLPFSKKNKKWKKATMDALYWEATQQMYKNYIFADIRRMTKGEFTYRAVDIEKSYIDTPWMDKHVKNLSKDSYIPTHIKHFDFLGIVVNAIAGVYNDTDSKYRVESIDEYSTNEYIRDRTQAYEKRAQAIFKAEIDRMLLEKGLNPNQTEFKSEEEKQQYLAQLDAEVKKYTPQEIEANLSKNFKVLATEWATNVLQADEKKFTLSKEDRKALIDFLLTGRWFRHYKVGYDYYDIEYWRPEEVFFSQDLDCEYPQDLDFVGRLTRMSSNQLLQKYGFLMSQRQQETIGNFWNQTTNYNSEASEGSGSVHDALFSQAKVVPFYNYYDHQTNLEMENALGVPLARSMDEDGTVTKHFMPRMENEFNSRSSASYSAYLRDDIDVRMDSIEVMDCYWRSMKRIGILIKEDNLGNPSIDITTDELISEVLTENDIKKLKEISIQELSNALKDGDLAEYINTISYHYIPEIWHGVLIKGGKEDMMLDVKPLDYQIKGDSNLYQVRIPVGGLITDGIIPKMLPYQQLYNICLNQNTEMLAKELVFYSIDINSIPAEYKDETTEEAIYAITDVIKDTGILPLDPSRSNTQGSTVYPNIFQKNDLSFANHILYRQGLAEFYKQQAYNQVGITAQLLGAPNTYQTAEGVKQGAQASFALMNSLIEDFDVSKAKANEIHIAIAQFCETNGKDTTKLTRNPDHLLNFIDILEEDGDLFPLRKLSIIPASNSKDRKVVEAIQQILINDNTINKDFGSIVEILSNPYVLELKEIGAQMRARTQKETADQRQFEGEQLDKQIQSQEKTLADDRAHEKELEYIKGEYKLETEKIQSYGKASMSKDPSANYDRIDKATQDSVKNDFIQQGLDQKAEDLNRKKLLDIEQRKKYLAELQIKREELRLKDKALDVQKETSLINKN